jgi:hypothetical protein
MARTTAAADTSLVVAVDSAVIATPEGEKLVRRGWRYKRTHPAVVAAPGCFLPADTPDDELEQARRAAIREPQEG